MSVTFYSYGAFMIDVTYEFHIYDTNICILSYVLHFPVTLGEDVPFIQILLIFFSVSENHTDLYCYV